MIALADDSRSLPLAIALAALVALCLLPGCSSGPSKKKGDGYLEEGPTVELGGIDDEPASPLEALAITRQKLATAEGEIARLDERFRRLKEERDYLEKARLDLESSLTESEQALAHERDVQSRLAAVVTDLRIRNVTLEQQVFELKLDRIADAPELSSEEPRNVSQPGASSASPAEDETDDPE